MFLAGILLSVNLTVHYLYSSLYANFTALILFHFII